MNNKYDKKLQRFSSNEIKLLNIYVVYQIYEAFFLVIVNKNEASFIHKHRFYRRTFSQSINVKKKLFLFEVCLAFSRDISHKHQIH